MSSSRSDSCTSENAGRAAYLRAITTPDSVESGLSARPASPLQRAVFRAELLATFTVVPLDANPRVNRETSGKLRVRRGNEPRSGRQHRKRLALERAILEVELTLLNGSSPADVQRAGAQLERLAAHLFDDDDPPPAMAMGRPRPPPDPEPLFVRALPPTGTLDSG